MRARQRRCVSLKATRFEVSLSACSSRSQQRPPAAPQGRAMSRKGWMSTGKREMDSVSAASYSSYGRPSNSSSSRSSQRSSSWRPPPARVSAHALRGGAAGAGSRPCPQSAQLRARKQPAPRAQGTQVTLTCAPLPPRAHQRVHARRVRPVHQLVRAPAPHIDRPDGPRLLRRHELGTLPRTRAPVTLALRALLAASPQHVTMRCAAQWLGTQQRVAEAQAPGGAGETTAALLTHHAKAPPAHLLSLLLTRSSARALAHARSARALSHAGAHECAPGKTSLRSRR